MSTVLSVLNISGSSSLINDDIYSIERLNSILCVAERDYNGAMAVAKKDMVPLTRNMSMMKAQSRFHQTLREVRSYMSDLPREERNLSNEEFSCLVERVRRDEMKVSSDNGWHLTPSVVKKIKSRNA